MCNINLAKRKDGKPDNNLNLWMEIASWNSWLDNNHGEGYFAFHDNDFVSERSMSKIRYANMAGYNTISSHQRYETSGQGINNVHPHQGKNFALQHNGIFSGLGDNAKSDTKYYLERLEKEYSTTKDILATIRKVNANIGGFYSVILYDIKHKKLYYYKELTTKMYYVQNNNYLFMSTKRENVEIAKEMFHINNSVKNVAHDTIFEITKKGLIEVGSFEPYHPKYVMDEYSVKRSLPSNCSFNNFDALSDEEIDDLMRESLDDREYGVKRKDLSDPFYYKEY